MSQVEDKLRDFSVGIGEVLDRYTELTHGALEFDHEAAADLTPTDSDKHYLADSTSRVTYRGYPMGYLKTLVLLREEGTGHHGVYGKELHEGGYQAPGLPLKAAILPRAKASSTHSEIALPFLSRTQDSDELVYFANNLAVVRRNRESKSKLFMTAATIGQPAEEYGVIMQGQIPAEVETLLTVGRNQRGQRFGQRQAIFNAHYDIDQVVGLLRTGAKNRPQLRNLLEDLAVKIPQ